MRSFQFGKGKKSKGRFLPPLPRIKSEVSIIKKSRFLESKYSFVYLLNRKGGRNQKEDFSPPLPGAQSEVSIIKIPTGKTKIITRTKGC